MIEYNNVLSFGQVKKICLISKVHVIEYNNVLKHMILLFSFYIILLFNYISLKKYTLRFDI